MKSGKKRIELRSPDPTANPYLAFALLIYAGMDGIERKLPLQKPANVNLYTADHDVTDQLKKLPESRGEAWDAAAAGTLVKRVLPESYLAAYKNPPETH